MASQISAQGPQVPPPTTGNAKVDAKNRETAKNFEAVFLGQMTQLMLESVEQGDGEFSGGHGAEMFRGILAEKLGNSIADRGGVGLAPIVLDQIIKLQQGNSKQ
jgi:Rod binding domain-containing protein